MGWNNKRGKMARRSKPTNSSLIGRIPAARTKPVLAVALSLILVAVALSIAVSYAEAADPGHPASSISGGTFETGDFVYPSNLTVNKFFIANGTTLYVDAINGMVGIGTTSPSTILNVKGTLNAALSGTLNTSDASDVANTSADLTSEISAGDAIKIVNASDSSDYEIFTVNAVTSTNITLDSTPSKNWTDALGYKDSSLFRIDNGDGTGKVVVDKSGNVGIGMTSPSHKLSVVGTVNATDFICDSAGCINAVELNSDVAGDGLASSSGVLAINTLAGGGIVTSSDSLSLNTSCSSNEILKWSGSNWECKEDTAYNTSYVTTTYNATYHATSSVVTGNYSVLEASKGNYTTWQAVTGNWSNWATTYNATYHNPVQAVIGNYSAWQTVPGNYSTMQAVIGNWSNWATTYNATYHNPVQAVIGNYSRWANQTATDVECADCVDGAELADSIALDANLAISGYNVTFDSGTLFVDASNDRVGIGTTAPLSKLQINNPLGGGTAFSSVFRVNAGTLGTTAGNELAIGSIGFNTAGNDVYLGVRGYRVSDGSTWATTAIGLGMDVDSTVRAGANIWLSSNGNVGIGTTSPSKKLEVSNSTQGITFDPTVTSPTINTTASTNLTITSSGGNVIIQLG